MFRTIHLFALATCCLFACGDGLETIEETDALGIRTEYRIDPETGLKQGPMRQYSPQGQLLSEEYYVAGELHGERVLLHENGQKIVVENYENGNFAGPYSTYDSLGNLRISGHYIDGAMNRAWYVYYPDGGVKEVVTFVNNEENGPFREWHENGQPKASGTYMNGDDEQGVLRLYNEAGELFRVMNCDHGVCSTFWTPDSTATAPPGVDMTRPAPAEKG